MNMKVQNKRCVALAGGEKTVSLRAPPHFYFFFGEEERGCCVTVAVVPDPKGAPQPWVV